jgi:elongation factor Ts
MEQIKVLRELTGAGMMDVKNALAEASGDMDKAQEILRQKGMATAEKKSMRVAADGTVQAVVLNNNLGAMLEVNCETDFVAKSEQFMSLVQAVLKQVAEKNPASLDELLSQPDMSQPGRTVQDYLKETIGTIKENMTIRRFVRFDAAASGGFVVSYIHLGGKIGVLAELKAEKAETYAKAEFLQVAKDITLQIAAMSAEFVTRDEIPAEVIEAETRIETGKEDVQNKPAEIRDKIVAGRVSKILGQRCLVEQPFVKDPNVVIGDLLKNVGTSLGDSIAVKRFARFALGEGIDKTKSED